MTSSSTMTTSSQTVDSPQIRVVKKWLAVGCELNTAAILPLCSKEHFVVEVHPKSLGYPDMTLLNIREMMERAKEVFKDGLNKKEIIRIFAANDERTVVAQLRSDSTVTSKGHPYENEYLYVIDMVEEEGEWKLGRVVEFMDSALLKSVHEA
ncbi:hypothetical protein EXIGLDRAFT_735555 [Exidia glandulosa HHB12029]|uniref:SnoaL-like domain-containing protein n=1 Tax=Exidia glandulosa HHB12029 TaxID=1314781 RepID=A0A165JS43_EXIGL|nr:hypothetical protein EXIGLDRAFT_735555 [Exidia glandulosa HHB12029]